MPLPGFTATASLYPTLRHYGTFGRATVPAANGEVLPADLLSRVVPALLNWYQCPPGSPECGLLGIPPWWRPYCCPQGWSCCGTPFHCCPPAAACGPNGTCVPAPPPPPPLCYPGRSNCYTDCIDRCDDPGLCPDPNMTPACIHNCRCCCNGTLGKTCRQC
jgi:hypothetical protein